MKGILIWPLMHTIEKWKIFFLELAGYGFIGRDHELLDDPVSDVALRPHDIFRQALQVENDFRLGQIEVKAPSCLTVPPQEQGELLH